MLWWRAVRYAETINLNFEIPAFWDYITVVLENMQFIQTILTYVIIKDTEGEK